MGCKHTARPMRNRDGRLQNTESGLSPKLLLNG